MRKTKKWCIIMAIIIAILATIIFLNKNIEIQTIEKVEEIAEAFNKLTVVTSTTSQETNIRYVGNYETITGEISWNNLNSVTGKYKALFCIQHGAGLPAEYEQWFKYYGTTSNSMTTKSSSNVLTNIKSYTQRVGEIQTLKIPERGSWVYTNTLNSYTPKGGLYNSSSQDSKDDESSLNIASMGYTERSRLVAKYTSSGLLDMTVREAYILSYEKTVPYKNNASQQALWGTNNTIKKQADTLQTYVDNLNKFTKTYGDVIANESTCIGSAYLDSKTYKVGPMKINYVKSSAYNFGEITGATLNGNNGEVKNWSFSTGRYPNPNEQFYVYIDIASNPGLYKITDLKFTYKETNAEGKKYELSGTYVQYDWELIEDTNKATTHTADEREFRCTSHRNDSKVESWIYGHSYKCTKCNGTGKCSMCGGDGRMDCPKTIDCPNGCWFGYLLTDEICSKCDGSGETDYSGDTECTKDKIHDKDWKECKSCGGDGYKTLSKWCSTCKGTGNRNACGTCYDTYEKYRCKTCYGNACMPDGSTCTKCYGTGTTTKLFCSKCHASGYVLGAKCTECDGKKSGKVCPICNGAGWRQCIECGGEEYKEYCGQCGTAYHTPCSRCGNICPEGDGHGHLHCYEPLVCDHGYDVDDGCYHVRWEGEKSIHDAQKLLVVQHARVYTKIHYVTLDIDDVPIYTNVSVSKYISKVQHTGVAETPYQSEQRASWSVSKKQNEPQELEYGDRVTFTIKLANTSPNSATVNITDTLPEKYSSLQVETSCKYTKTDKNITFTDIEVPANKTVTIKVSMIVERKRDTDTNYIKMTNITNSNWKGTIINFGTKLEDEDTYLLKLYSLSLEKHVEEVINEDRPTVNYNEREDRSKNTKQNNPVYVEKYEQVVYQIKITNEFETRLKNIKIEDTLPEDIEYVSTQATKHNQNGSSTKANVSITQNNQDLTFICKDVLKQDEYITLKITTNVNKNNMHLTILENRAEVTYQENINNREVDNESNHTEDYDYIKLKDLVISGTIWKDVQSNGKSQTANGLKDSTEKGMAGVKVYLYKVTGNNQGQLVTKNGYGQDLVNPVMTDANGYYEFRDVDKSEDDKTYLNYYIEYEYDGLKYEPTTFMSTGTRENGCNQLTDQVNETGYWDTYEKNSKASELEELRQNFNNQFAEITKDTAISTTGVQKTLNYTDTKTKERIKQLITQVYQQAIQKTPTEDEINNWLVKYQNDNYKIEDIVIEIINSTECKNKNYSNQQYAEILYKAIIGRTPNNNEIQYWKERLDAGTSNGKVQDWTKTREYTLTYFVYSDEFQSIKSNILGSGDYNSLGANTVIETKLSNVETMTATTAKIVDNNGTKTVQRQYLPLFQYSKNQYPETKYLRYMNLGLEDRAKADVALYKDLQTAITTINGKTEVYEYNGRTNDTQDKNPLEIYNNEEYSHPLKEEDINYQGTNQNGNGQLEIITKYKYTIKNQGEAVLAVTEMIDYLDTEHYTYYTSYIGDKDGNPITYLTDIGTIQNNYVTKYTNNGSTNMGKTSIYNSSKYQKANNINGYTSIYLQIPEQRLASGEEMYIYIEAKLGKNGGTAQELLQEILNNNTIGVNQEILRTQNYAEILSYKTYYSTNTADTRTFGQIDKDSALGDLTTQRVNLGQYEDDESRAPGAIYTLTESRSLSGIVYEEQTSKTLQIGQTRQTTNDGKYKEEYTRISGVRVELCEIDENNKLTVRQTTTTNENGEYSFEKYIPGDYVIRFTYGGQYNSNYSAVEYRSTKGNPNTYKTGNPMSYKIASSTDTYQNLITKFKDNTEIWYNVTTNGTQEYPAIGMYKNNQGTKWVHSQLYLNNDVIEQVPSIIQTITSRKNDPKILIVNYSEINNDQLHKNMAERLIEKVKGYTSNCDISYANNISTQAIINAKYDLVIFNAATASPNVFSNVNLDTLYNAGVNLFTIGNDSDSNSVSIIESSQPIQNTTVTPIKVDGENEYWYSQDTQTRYSDAYDDTNRRLELIDYANNGEGIGINNYKTNILKQQEMYAYTSLIKIQVDEAKDYVGDADERKGQYNNKIENIDFGIIEMPRAQLEAAKEIEKIKLTLSTGEVLIPQTGEWATIDKITSGQISYVSGQRKAYKSTTSANQEHTYTQLWEQDINGNFKKRYTTNGFIQIQLDEELANGSNLEIVYKVTITNIGETGQVICYYDKDYNIIGLSYDGENMLDLITYEDGRLITYNTKEETTVNADGTETKYVGTRKENVMAKREEKELLNKGKTVVDYVSNSLINSSENEQKWTVATKQELQSSEDKAKLVISNIDTVQTIMKANEYSNLVKSLSAATTESVTEEIKLEKVLGNYSGTDLNYINIVEIVETQDTIGRIQYASIPGNVEPTQSIKEIQENLEPDTAISENLTIIPPTGQLEIVGVKINTIWWLLGGLSIIAIGIIVAIIIIRRRR